MQDQKRSADTSPLFSFYFSFRRARVSTFSRYIKVLHNSAPSIYTDIDFCKIPYPPLPANRSRHPRDPARRARFWGSLWEGGVLGGETHKFLIIKMGGFLWLFGSPNPENPDPGKPENFFRPIENSEKITKNHEKTHERAKNPNFKPHRSHREPDRPARGLMDPAK
jgi:hypothetical protein